MATKEGPTDFSTRRRASAPKAGSVWESRMKLDQVKGGIKVFDPITDDNSEQNSNTEVQLDKKISPKQSPIGVSGKRKTWKSESTELSPVQIARQRSELSKNSDEQCTELGVSADAMKKSPAHIRKTRSVNRSINASEKNSIQLRKLKSDSREESDGRKCEGDSEIVKLEPDPAKNLDELSVGNSKKLILDDTKVGDETVGEIEKDPIGIKKSRSDEEFGVCEEKAITSNLENVGQIKAQFDKNVVDGEIEECDGGDEETDKEIEVEIEKKSFDIKEINVQEQRPNTTVIEKKKLLSSNERPVPFSSTVKKQTPVVNHSRTYQIPAKINPVSVTERSHGIPRTHCRLQSLVDLIMWRDISRSAFVFGIGTFFIISSSFTKDLNISFISVVSYLGLAYLAANFLFRTLINRGSAEMGKSGQDHVVGEEEAIWMIKLVLPYLNEFLLNLRALFSGDPTTTMKLAVLLFVLARCGGSITIWKMTKLGFFGVFTVPKICASYSSQLTAYGKFWIQRFGDAWESCSHKKAVGFAIFTLVWNLSSVVARIWAVFMLFVAFKYYQHSSIREGWTQQEAATVDTSRQPAQNIGGRRITTAETRKQKTPC